MSTESSNRRIKAVTEYKDKYVVHLHGPVEIHMYKTDDMERPQIDKRFYIDYAWGSDAKEDVLE